MEQITLNFDASEFDGFDLPNEYFNNMTFSLKDEQGRLIKQGVQAMEMDFSPSQWTHKRTESNNTSITLNDAYKHTQKFGDVRWLYFLIDKLIIKKKRPKDELLRLREEIDRQLKEAS